MAGFSITMSLSRDFIRNLITFSGRMRPQRSSHIKRKQSCRSLRLSCGVSVLLMILSLKLARRFGRIRRSVSASVSIHPKKMRWSFRVKATESFMCLRMIHSIISTWRKFKNSGILQTGQMRQRAVSLPVCPMRSERPSTQ